MGSVLHGALSSFTKCAGRWGCFLLVMEPSPIHKSVDLVYVCRFYFYSRYPSQYHFSIHVADCYAYLLSRTFLFHWLYGG